MISAKLRSYAYDRPLAQPASVFPKAKYVCPHQTCDHRSPPRYWHTAHAADLATAEMELSNANGAGRMGLSMGTGIHSTSAVRPASRPGLHSKPAMVFTLHRKR